MAKCYITLGFGTTAESSSQPGVWVDTIVEKSYYGELRTNNRRLRSADKVNDDISISNELSIISDPYAVQNFYNIRYVIFQNVKWKIDTVDVQYPRLVMTFGGLYNG